MPRHDERYVLALCDRVLGARSKRQHRFEFLRGDPPRSGSQGRKVPVDAFYPSLRLVIEYRERQHIERVPLFDDKPTVSGVARGEQRRRYDQRRRSVLPRQGIRLVQFDCTDFACDARKRLRRARIDDLAVIRRKLQRLGLPVRRRTKRL